MKIRPISRPPRIAPARYRSGHVGLQRLGVVGRHARRPLEPDAAPLEEGEVGLVADQREDGFGRDRPFASRADDADRVGLDREHARLEERADGARGDPVLEVRLDPVLDPVRQGRRPDGRASPAPRAGTGRAPPPRPSSCRRPRRRRGRERDIPRRSASGRADARRPGTASRRGLWKNPVARIAAGASSERARARRVRTVRSAAARARLDRLDRRLGARPRRRTARRRSR